MSRLRGWGLDRPKGENALDAVAVDCSSARSWSLFGTALTAVGPVTDGDALCYHLQVPKVFLMRQAVGFVPDLHETVYPLVTELLYAVALEFRGPVACRGIQWVVGPGVCRQCDRAGTTESRSTRLVGRRDCLANPGGVQRHVRPAQRRGSGRFRHGGDLRLGPAARAPEPLRGDRRGPVRWSGDRREVPRPGPLRPIDARRLGCEVSSRRSLPRRRWLALALVYLGTTALVGGCWYLRAYVHTGNPVYPYFRQVFGNSGLDEVLDPIKRPLALTPWNLLFALGPLSLQPDQFDSFSHQFGPVFLLFLPALLLERAPRRVLWLVGLAYSLSHDLPDPASEYAVRFDRAGADVDRGGLPRERLVGPAHFSGAADGRAPARAARL